MSMSDTLSTGSFSAKQSGASNIGGTNVQVAVRCRPLNAEEKKNNAATVVTCDIENKAVKVAYGPSGKKIMKNFTFDKVFGTYSRQEEVFDSVVRPIVDETLAGFNCTIFAYGQTGTGKTHTMEGDIHSEEEAGIVPRAVKFILEQLESSNNEELQDLLNTSGDKKLKLCEDVKKGVVCQNLEEIAVLSVSDIFEILQRGIQQRQTAATLCNKNSSRSHTIFTLKIMIKEYNVEGEEVVRHGQLNLVDLAGSECIGRSGAKNDRAREAGNINQSLLTLGRVITALVDHHVHVPYRDSKLTRLLQESLGGKAKTCIIATLSPSQLAVEESMSTLDYAYRARNIKNQPTVNQKLTKKVIMKEYFQEIETLRNQLTMTREKNGVYLDPNEFYAMETKLAAQESQLRECEAALKMRNDEYKTVKSENDELNMKIGQMAEELEYTTSELSIAREELAGAKEELRVAVVEIKACEAVMTEQNANEKMLITHGQNLSSALLNREDEISRLLDKVDRLEKAEVARLEMTKNFLQELANGQSTLKKSLTACLSSSETQSEVLGGGVEKMLVQGRSTCDTLQSALGAALSGLLSEATQAKQDMLSVLDELETDLKNGNEQSATQIGAMKTNWSKWLDEAQLTMQSVQSVLDNQQKQVVSINTALETYERNLKSECEAFSTQQSAASFELSREVEELRAVMKTRASTFEQKSSEDMAAAQKELQAKAVVLEQTVSALMSDFLKATQSALERSTTSAHAYSTDIQSVWDKGLASINQHNEKNNSFGIAHNQKMVEMSSRHASSGFSILQNIESLRGELDQHGAAQLSAIGSKRKHVEDETRTLAQELNVTAKKACQQVQYTAEAANQVLTSVTKASEQMQARSSEALQQFSSYMDDEGDKLQDSIHTYFKTTKTAYEEQKKTLTATEGKVVEHCEFMKTSLAPVNGSTPRKVVVSQKPTLKPTRPHVVIKQEAKTGFLQDMSYEEAVAALQAYSRALSECSSSRPSTGSVEEVVKASSPADQDDVLAASEKSDSGSTGGEDDNENLPPSSANSASTRASSRLRSKVPGIPSVTTRTRSNSRAATEL
eukprot:scaffold5121_cov223-Ochromonas_danica.AAC.17